jgi:hypothetical protein
VQNLPVLRKALSAVNDNYLSRVSQSCKQDILETFIAWRATILAEPTVTAAGKRIPGLKLDHPRQLA